MEFEFKDDNFEEETAKGVVLVDFWAPWCGPCKMQGPIVEEIAKAYDGKEGVKIGNLNVDENPQTAQQFQVMSIPTIIIFKDGKPAEQMIGLQNKDALIERLENQLK